MLGRLVSFCLATSLVSRPPNITTGFPTCGANSRRTVTLVACAFVVVEPDDELGVQRSRFGSECRNSRTMQNRCLEDSRRGTTTDHAASRRCSHLPPSPGSPGD